MTATIQERQTVFDLALQYFGSAEACFLVAERLGIAVTDTPPVGVTFNYEITDIIDHRVVDYYSKNGIIPTTQE